MIFQMYGGYTNLILKTWATLVGITKHLTLQYSEAFMCYQSFDTGRTYENCIKNFGTQDIKNNAGGLFLEKTLKQTF